MTKALRVVIWVLAVAAMAGTVIAQPKQIRVGGNVQQMNLVKKVAPTYPVATDTTVPREFTDAAIEAVKQWQYKPTLLNGEPVEVVTTIEINFSLSK